MIAVTTISSIKVKPRWFCMPAPDAHVVALLAGEYLQKMRQSKKRAPRKEGLG